VIYLYGLLEPCLALNEATVAALDGVTGQVALAELDGAWLAFGRSGEADILPRRRHLLAHARVLETLAEAGAVLPMRFGMVVEDVETVAAALSHQSEGIKAQFAAVRDCAEYGIRVTFPRATALSATVAADTALDIERMRLLTAGRAGRMETAGFGRQLAERLDRRRAATQRELLAALAPEFASYVLRAPEEDVQVLAVDALVHQSKVERSGTQDRSTGADVRLCAGCRARRSSS
jgi:hypothetical protein